MEVPEPTPAERDTPTREQVAEAKHFGGGEGCYYASDRCWFSTTGDSRVWQFNLADDTFGLAYDGDGSLRAVDNVTGSAIGDLYVAEEGDNMEICIITPDDVVAPMPRVNGYDSSGLTGPAFNPAGDRMYFSS